jgi:hypothetical protein
LALAANLERAAMEGGETSVLKLAQDLHQWLRAQRGPDALPDEALDRLPYRIPPGTPGRLGIEEFRWALVVAETHAGSQVAL